MPLQVSLLRSSDGIICSYVSYAGDSIANGRISVTGQVKSDEAKLNKQKKKSGYNFYRPWRPIGL
jgi:hypothetical protein